MIVEELEEMEKLEELEELGKGRVNLLLDFV